MTEKFDGGDCYDANADKFLCLALSNDWCLCHGRAIGCNQIEGIHHGHCWMENMDTVLDFSNGNTVTMRKEEYYKIGNIYNVKRYTRDELIKKLLEFKHYGPWSDEK